MFWQIFAAVILFVGGIVIGAAVVLTINIRHKAGTMNVYIPQYPDEMPYVCPEFTHGADFVCKQKYILFDVKVSPLSSQK